MNRRFAFIAAALLAAMPTCILAQPYPSRPIQVIVPYEGGGATDILARTIAEKLHEELGQTLIIDNRPGGNTNIGAQYAARAKADGYTLLFANDQTFTFNPALTPSLPYDMQRDFVPVATVAYLNIALVSSMNVPATNIKEFVTWAKANSGRIAYASNGIGSQGHIMGESFKRITQTDIVHVPYKGTAPATSAVAAGDVAFGFPSLISGRPFIESGKVRVLAISGDKRSPLQPNVPTFSEAGLNDMDIGAWYAFFAPKGTPEPVIARLNAAVKKILSDKEFVDAKFTQQGVVAMSKTPQEVGDFLKSETVRMQRLIKLSGAKLE